MIADDFACLARALPEPMLLVTGEGRIVDANPAAANHLARNSGTLPGEDLREHLADPPEAVRQFLHNCSRSSELVLGAMTWHRGDGEPEKWRAEGTLLEARTEDAPPLLMIRLRPMAAAGRSFRTLNERIADLNREIQARRCAEEALIASGDRLEFVLNAIGVGLWFNELPLGDLNWDQRTRELFFVPEDVQPTIELFYDRLHPDDRDPTREAVATAMQTGNTYSVQHRVIDPASGAIRWIRSLGLATYDQDHNPVRFDGLNYDITEEKQNEQDLCDLAEQLSLADQRKNDFLATLAHELRNPLAPIRTGLEVIRMKADDPSSVGEMREIMSRQVEQLVVLIDDLLDVSRITHGTLRIRKASVQLADVLRDAIVATEVFITDAGHELETSIPETPIELDADPHRLTQVFSNLLHNAAKYTPPGGRIRLSAEVAGREARITVADNGYGIPPQEREHIFEMFSQLAPPPDRIAAGLGVGLALAKSLVELHGGRIEVASDGPGAGSAFTVSLPVR
ncbi:MAG: PAS domain-containing protein [Akkermansiaceae bacterium]|nr:PAS domain-containing protein [Akkermansiaceae bacterium]NNM29557.1 PAS domain-containing protein [Akkermansiaceae bacterium]